jgi:hypothetical protein
MPKRRFWTIMVVVVAIGGSYLVWLNWNADPLPASDDVDQIVAIGVFGPKSEFVKFEVSADRWPRIRAAMQPWTYDFRPAKYVGLCSLDITTRRGRKLQLQLYDLGHPGAFAVGPGTGSKVSYRGGDSKDLVREMTEAYSIQQDKVRPRFD